MKKGTLRILMICLFLAACMDIPLLSFALGIPLGAQALLYFLALAGYAVVLICAGGVRGRTGRTTALLRGNALLGMFLITMALQIATAVWLVLSLWGKTPPNGFVAATVAWAVITVLAACGLFWAGMLRLYFASVQLGIKWRALGALLGWVPIANLITLRKIMRVTADEADFEDERFLLDAQRSESQICHTRYPVLMVHGVFFRDYRYLNYWGRIPRALKANGASVYYGKQQSAATVADCGKELSASIRTIVAETGCEKVNLIAHSKGGLDCRWAISCEGAAPFVASLTTINTPHAGCLFADELLKKIPIGVQNRMARAYNGALRRMGDTAPDFLAAVHDLSHERCMALEREMPDMEGVFYQSVMSCMAHASSGKFPLNAAYPLVKHYSGENDGLVDVKSGLKWATQTYLAPPKGRGVSHADMIDLNRENIPGFDVREFYVRLVQGLVTKGL